MIYDLIQHHNQQCVSILIFLEEKTVIWDEISNILNITLVMELWACEYEFLNVLNVCQMNWVLFKLLMSFNVFRYSLYIDVFKYFAWKPHD